MSFSQFNEKDYEVINQAYAKLRASAEKRCANAAELEVVQRAFEFANSAHSNVRRRSGEPYMLHPIAVAQIVVDDIGLGYKSISAALLHDVVEDTDYTVEDIREHFGNKIASLVDGLTKIKTVLDNEQKTHGVADISQQSMQAENFKRILLTLNDDVRVVLIKLADRLHNCRTIEHMPEHKRDKILSETMFIFIPLAHRLGLYSIKSELENIWLRYKETGQGPLPPGSGRCGGGLPGNQSPHRQERSGKRRGDDPVHPAHRRGSHQSRFQVRNQETGENPLLRLAQDAAKADFL